MNTPTDRKLPPLPYGAVLLGKGLTFKADAPFYGWMLCRYSSEWLKANSLSGDSADGYYCAPADSEIVKLNQPIPNKQYILWCPARGEPTKKHPSLESAETEAKRLAAKHPGRVFHICEIVASYVGEVTVKKV